MPIHEDPSDIFDASISSLFDIPPIAFSTADPTAFYTYTPPPSSLISPIQLRLPQPPADLYTTLQANHLWLAAIYLADCIARQDVKLGKRVCELGAGAGLPGIVACKLGSEVVSSDWGVDEVLDVIRGNFERAKCEKWSVVGHRWGTDPAPLLLAELSSHQSEYRPPYSQVIAEETRGSEDGSNSVPEVAKPSADSSKFDNLLLADTLWVTEAHSALLDSIFALLKPGGVAHITAGLHTGRGPLERFVCAARGRGADVVKISEVKYRSDAEWEPFVEDPSASGLEEERGVVVHYTLQIPHRST